MLLLVSRLMLLVVAGALVATLVVSAGLDDWRRFCTEDQLVGAVVLVASGAIFAGAGYLLVRGLWPRSRDQSGDF